MKAWVLHYIDDLRMEDVEKPVIEKNEVLVKVKAAGICGSDIPRIYKTGAHVHPLIPGHEFSGIVEEIGEETDSEWLGRRVGIFPLIPCGNCISCRNKQYELCRNYSYLGSRTNGGFAEYVAVPEWNLISLPDSVTYEAAAMLEPMAVAVHAMRRAEISSFGTTAICGLGTIGLLLLMFLMKETRNTDKDVVALSASKRILVIGNKDFQRRTVIEMGLTAECYFDSRSGNAGNWLMEQTNQRGVDVFFECIGKNETFVQAVDNMAPSGKLVLVGNPYSDMCMEKSTYWKILRNQLTLTGTWNSSFTHDNEDDWHYVIDMLSRKMIAPESLITHRLPLESLESGLRIMRDKTEDYVKIMVNL
ncbi:MAG: galactitol-1-phosphate 5-dehydrogenase [Butyrivibrio sp.]|nr:galactitol-1-phosphate 5-dehydrogenase [Butyrivibrio sp.]